MQTHSTAKKLKIVAAYEDLSAGLNAREMCNMLGHYAGRDCNLNGNLWRFDMLEFPEIKHPAASRAAQADMVLFSVYEELPFPTHMKSWIDLWIKEKKSGTGALVVLLNQKRKSDSASGEAWNYLRRLSKKTKLPFFAQAMQARQ